MSSEAQQERRRQVIRAFWRGVKQRQVACDLGLGYSPVRMIVGRYKKDGPQGMQMGRRGRPQGCCRTLTTEQAEWIRRLTTDKRPEELKFDFALWTRKVVSRDPAASDAFMWREAADALPAFGAPGEDRDPSS